MESSVGRSVGSHAITQPLPRGPHVARQPVAPLRGEAFERGPSLLEILPAGERGLRPGAGATAAMDEGRVHDCAPPARLAHREREIAVVAVKKTVSLVEPADRLENRPRQTEAHAVDGGDFGHLTTQPSLAFERVDNRASDVATVAAKTPDTVE